MKVRFMGYTEPLMQRLTICEPWFTVGKEYEVFRNMRDCDDSHVWVIADDDAYSPMFEGEYEIVSE